MDEFILGMPFQTDAFFSSGHLDLCGNTYNIVEGLFGEGELYYRNEDQRTLLRRSTNCAEKEYLLYDFSLDLGDTIYVGWEMEGSGEDTTMAIVETIDTVEFLGITRRRFSLLIDRCPMAGDEPVFTTMEWIEGVGSTTHPFYAVICLCDFCETGTVLQCADSSGTLTYRSLPDVVCDFTVGLEERDLSAEHFQVYGTSDLVQLHYPREFQHGVLMLYDPAGRVAFSKQITAARTTLDLPELATGIYTVMIQNGDQRWSARWVLMR